MRRFICIARDLDGAARKDPTWHGAICMGPPARDVGSLRAHSMHFLAKLMISTKMSMIRE